MQKNIWNTEVDTESELIYSYLDRPTPSGINDMSGRPIKLGQLIQLTFNKNEFNEHKANFEVIWKDAAYKILSQETGNESFLGAIYEGVEIEIVK